MQYTVDMHTLDPGMDLSVACHRVTVMYLTHVDGTGTHRHGTERDIHMV